MKKKNSFYIEAPTAPGIPEPITITNNSVTLKWEEPEFDGDSPITEYILEYREKQEKT